MRHRYNILGCQCHGVLVTSTFAQCVCQELKRSVLRRRLGANLIALLVVMLGRGVGGTHRTKYVDLCNDYCWGGQPAD